MNSRRLKRFVCMCLPGSRTDSAREAVDILFREVGATAIFKSNAFERRFRDVHTVSIQVQGSIARMQSVGQF
jgi:hypothetical protein